MIRGKFLAQDDFDLAGHRLHNWKWLDDIPHTTASNGQVLAVVNGAVVWADASSEGIVSVAWDDVTGKPSTFTPSDHTQGWDTITGKPTFVNSVSGGFGIGVSSTTGTVTISNEIALDQTEPTGFIEEPGSFTSTMAITDNRTFTIEPLAPATEFSFYVKGIKFTKTSTETVTFADTDGIWLFYFDEDGVLQAGQTALSGAIFTENAICGVAYWNSDDGEVIYFGEERHGMVMDGVTHRYLHDTEGTRFIDGHALGDITADGDGDDNAHAIFSTEAGEIADEDLFLSAEARTTGDEFYTYYKEGATGTWRRTGPSPYPVVYNGTWDRIGYNNFNGTSSEWEQADPGDNDFVLAHIYRVNSVTQPYIAVQGQAEYPNLGAARDGAADELSQLVTQGLPFQEFYPLGTIIFQTNDGAYDNDVSARIRSTDDGDDYVDWRLQRLTPGSGPGDHGALSGLTDRHHPTSALQQTSATTGQVIQWNGATWLPETLSASDVGLGNVTNEKQVVQGTNGLQNDFAVAGSPPTTSYVLVEAAAGSQRIATLGNLPVSTPVQDALDAQTHSYTDITDWAFATISVLTITALGTMKAGVQQSGADMYLNYAGPDGDAGIYWHESASNTGASLMWDDSEGHFLFSHTVSFVGVNGISATDVGAAETTHTHSLSDLTQTGATTGQVPTWNATASEWQPATPSGGGTANNIPKMIFVENPTATDTLPMFTVSVTSTIEKITYQTDAGTITFNLEERVGTTPGTAGTDVLAADASATSTHGTTSTFSNDGLAAESWVYLVCSAKSGSPTKLWVRVFYSED
jgi:hypothetical protein